VEGFEERVKLSNSKSYPFSVDATKIKDLDNETKAFFLQSMGQPIPSLKLYLLGAYIRQLQETFFSF
jgi:hypothetical protein